MQGRAGRSGIGRLSRLLVWPAALAVLSLPLAADDLSDAGLTARGIAPAGEAGKQTDSDLTTQEIRAGEGLANETTTGDVVAALFAAGNGKVVDFSGRGLKGLDLSGLDFKGARMARSDVFGTDLSRANLSRTNLAGARLDRTVLTFADFSGANLEGATLMRPTIYSDLRTDWREAPVFDGANLRGVRLTGRLDGASFRTADLSGFDFSPHDPRADISFLPRNFCRGCRFDGANLRGADFDDASLSMASFAGASLAGARLTRTDLTRVDFSGADLAGADLTGADLAEADLRQVKGLETVKGLGLALNLDRALR